MTSTPEPLVIEGTTSLTDFQEITEVLRSPDFVQAAFEKPTLPLVHNTLNAIDGAPHASRRRLENKLFGRDSIAYYKREAVEPLLQRSLDALKAGRDADGIVRTDLVPLIWNIARQIPAFVVGIDGVEDGEPAERFIRYVDTLAHSFTASWSPDFERLVEAGLEARERFAREFFDPSLARRQSLIAQLERSEIDKDELPHDLITMLLLNWDDEWDDEFLLREATVFLGASISTTAQSFPHLIVQLCEWVDAHPDKADLLLDVDFLQGAVSESMRFFVASPARLRKATKDVTLKSGRKVAAGERVSLWFVPANTDTEEFGEDAAVFNPLRENGIKAPWGLAFGQGPHICIGKPLITGVRGSADGDDSAAHGVMATLALELFRVGLTIDRDRPSAKSDTSIYDEYTSLPIRFDKLF
jgi:cytochrome P450